MSCGSSGGCSSGGCSSGGCSSGGMTVYDWLSDVTMPGDPYDVIEIEFKGGRKGFFRNIHNLFFSTGDQVVVDAGSGHDVGTVSLQGELVRLQLKKKKVKDDDNLAVIYRMATQRDIERHQEAKNREITTLYRGREIISSLKLGMKLSDIEYQSDNTKATFYYSADDRVDFRELIKNLAGEFRIRVEMKQISLRQEAARIGGIGSCGRELCCSTWMSDFKSVSTSAARYQNLSLNPQKLSGQCGRLKCCLNYELDTYLVELKDIPKVERGLKTEDGHASLFKTDIFKKMMWFGYKGDSNWHAVPVARVKEILELNKKGEKPLSLLLDETEEVVETAVNHDLLQLDKKYSKGKSKGKGRNNRNKQQGNKNPQGKSNPDRQPQQKKNPENKRRNENNKQQNPRSGQKNKDNQRPQRENVVRSEQKNTVQPEKQRENTQKKPTENHKKQGESVDNTNQKETKSENRSKGNKKPNPRNKQKRSEGRKDNDRERNEPKVEVHREETVKKRPVRAKIKIQREGVKQTPSQDANKGENEK